MRCHKYIIPPLILIGVVAGYVFSSLLGQRRLLERKKMKLALADWEDDGGNVAAVAPATPLN